MLANKQDLPGAIDLKNMEGVLQLHTLPPERLWHVQVITRIDSTTVHDGKDNDKNRLQT